MAEAEDVILDAAQHATAKVLDYWKRHSVRETPFDRTLSAHKPRLEIVLRSLFHRRVVIRVAQPPAKPTFLTRMFNRTPKRLIQGRPLPSQDGIAIFLPAVVSELLAGGSEVSRIYRTMAIQQAQRCLRRDLSGPAPKNALVQFLFHLSEAANADHELARRYPGLRNDLYLARQQMRTRRPSLEQLAGPERAMEALYQSLLLTQPGTLPPPFETFPAAAQSLAWAHGHAASLEYIRNSSRKQVRFQGIEPDEWLGLWLEPETAARSLVDMPRSPDDNPIAQPEIRAMQRRPQVRERSEDEDDRNSGFWMIQPSPPMEHVEDPMGMQRPVDREVNPDSGGLADSLSELQETSVVSTPEPPREILNSDDAPPRQSMASAVEESQPQGIIYPEWDYRIGAYHPQGVTLRLCPSQPGDPQWIKSVLNKHRKHLHEVRRRFEAMRTRRQVQRRQIDGDELDIAEYVVAYSDRRAKLPMSDRLFQTERNLRRDCAILLLIDMSGSTDAWVSNQQRIIDVAKESLVLVSSALDALGDPYAIQAFSGEGPGNVRVMEIKAFADWADSRLYDRIGALEPDRYTRVGAALRHASATLVQANSQRRLLVLLSDGKPNDLDHYEGRYGIEDTHQAVREATVQGIHSFCITVDREAPDYLPYIFGSARFAVLPRVQRLPVILLDLLRQFIRT